MEGQERKKRNSPRGKHPPEGLEALQYAGLQVAESAFFSLRKSQSALLHVGRGVYNCLLRLDGFNSRNIFSPASGDWRSEIRVPAWLVSGVSYLSGLWAAPFLLCSHMVKRESEVCSVSLIRMLILP